MAKPGGRIRALAVQEAWATIDLFDSRTQLIDNLIERGFGFRRQDMFNIIGNIWERKEAPTFVDDPFRYDLVPKDLMAELSWQRDERFGVKGIALYRDEFGNLERHDTVFFTNNYSEGLDYESEWAAMPEGAEQYKDLEFVSFEVRQLWHKKRADYGHPMLTEI